MADEDDDGADVTPCPFKHIKGEGEDEKCGRRCTKPNTHNKLGTAHRCPTHGDVHNVEPA